MGILYLLLLYIYKWFWDKSIYNTASLSETFFSLEFIIVLLLTFFAVLLFYKKNRKTNFRKISILELAFATNILFFIPGYEFSIVANVVVLAIGISEIERGNKLNNLGILNFGLILISTLVTCRFFDTNLSFVIRGILFITIGVGFFLNNYLLLKKRNK